MSALSKKGGKWKEKLMETTAKMKERSGSTWGADEDDSKTTSGTQSDAEYSTSLPGSNHSTSPMLPTIEDIKEESKSPEFHTLEDIVDIVTSLKVRGNRDQTVLFYTYNLYTTRKLRETVHFLLYFAWK